MVFIRTDANAKAATGHLMRCLSIAGQLEVLGEGVTFIFRDQESEELLANRHHYQMLDGGIGLSMEEELTQLIDILQGVGDGAKLLLDSYDIDAAYMERLKPYAFLITFDDLFAEKFPADLIINYNLYFKKYDYKSRYAGSGSKLLLGSQYVPLREEFLEEPSRRWNQVNKILLICGGGDQYHILPELTQRLCVRKEGRQFQLLVVAGSLSEDIEKLRQYEKQFPQVQVYQNVKEMAELMGTADMAISAASTVLYECCRMQLPTVFFTMADNQQNDAAAFTENGLMEYAGDIRTNRVETVERVIELTEKLAEDAKRICGMMERMRYTVDGNGARRIAEEIKGLGRN